MATTRGTSPVPSPCSVPGCDRPVKARGLCNGHYQRLMTHGDVQADRPLGGGAAGPRPECSVSGCHRSAVNRGLCRAHYERLRRDGDVRADVPLRPRSEERRLCAADGCDRPSQARGMCQSHYNSWRQSGILPPGVPDVGELPGGPCEVEGCDSPAIGRGLCQSHYSRVRHRGDVQAEIPVRRRRLASRYRAGDRSARARAAKAADDRRWRRLRADDPDDPLGPRRREEVLLRIAAGQHLREVLADMGLSHQQLWKRARQVPEWGAELDRLLTLWRDPELRHGTVRAYRVHGCRCPECREAKAAER